MDMNRFTEKSQEALQAAQRLAAKLNHQQIDAEHLLLALLDQERGLASALLAKAEVAVGRRRPCVARARSQSSRRAGEIGFLCRGLGFVDRSLPLGGRQRKAHGNVGHPWRHDGISG